MEEAERAVSVLLESVSSMTVNTVRRDFGERRSNLQAIRVDKGNFIQTKVRLPRRLYNASVHGPVG